jgi:preprotein translocase subunit SecE
MAAQLNTTGDKESKVDFLREVKGELKKVHWPSKRELVKYTTVVLATSAFVSFFVWLLDSGLGFLLKFIVKQ